MVKTGLFSSFLKAQLRGMHVDKVVRKCGIQRLYGCIPDWGKSVGSVAPNNHSSFDFSPAMPFHDFPGDMGSAVGKCP